jgi:hypothetical protein
MGWAWLVHFLGLDYGGRYGHPLPYDLWSGFGSDISELAIIGAVLGAYRRHNCHERKCWRIGRHTVDGTPWCNHHHQKARAALRAPGPGSDTRERG